jgi:hypothetical protein
MVAQMSFNVMQMDPSDLALLHSKLKNLIETPGWKQFQVLMADEIATSLDALTAPAKGTVDDYALHHADRAGYVRALQFAQRRPQRLLESAEKVLQKHKEVAEQAALREGGRDG